MCFDQVNGLSPLTLKSMWKMPCAVRDSYATVQIGHGQDEIKKREHGGSFQNNSHSRQNAGTKRQRNRYNVSILS